MKEEKGIVLVTRLEIPLCYSGPPEQNLLAPDQGIKARDHLSLWEFTQRYAYQASGRDRANSQEGHPASPQKQACDL